MKKIYLFAVAAMAAVTLMAQELPTACDATIEFKYCFTTSSSVDSAIAASALPFVWNGVTFPTDGTYPLVQQATLTNARGCDSIVTMTVSLKQAPVGAAGGSHARPFSVGENKQVYFSQGNLQYRALDKDGIELKRTCADETEQVGIFRFAEHQYEYVGTVEGSTNMSGNVYADGEKCVNDKTNAKSKSWTDYFAWGASGYEATLPYGWNASWYLKTSGINADLDNTNYDWGVYNPITNGGNKPGEWRSMSTAEWYYVLMQRPNAMQRITRATITDNEQRVASGVVLFPDDWNITEAGEIEVNFCASTSGSGPYNDVNFSNSSWTYNSFTIEQWEALEATGAVFLPACGYHYTAQSLGWGSNIEARYYTSTKQDKSSYTCGDAMVFNTQVRLMMALNANGAVERYLIRLVTDL